MNQKIAIIIGAGPAGLTAAYELLDRTDIKPVIFETTEDVGGISRTVNYKGNRIDIGGHRFFSKSDKVMGWWQNIIPLQGALAKDDALLERKVPLSSHYSHKPIKTGEEKTLKSPDPNQEDKVMLNRSRLSRIFFLRKFFDYPVSLNYNTFSNLGIIRTIKIGLSYLKTSLSPLTEENSLEDFFINRFGKELYLTFFKDYTEKVWGVPCDEIRADWGAQRVKGLSIKKAVTHSIKSKFSRDSSVSQKEVETSLIGQFMYPKLGPGQLWEEVAQIIKDNGGEIHHLHTVVGLKNEDNRIFSVDVKNETTTEIKTIKGDYFFSTMPVKNLINSFENDVPVEVKEVADGLMYRDFVTVGLLLKGLKIKNETKRPTINDVVPDNWIYIQERDVKLGRIQVFNNWSPYMVKNGENTWIGLEYFCNEGDELWAMSDDDLTKFAIEELTKIDIIHPDDVLDSVVIRVPKTYPAYFGSYDRFNEIREFTDSYQNLFLIGRNGMHRYNNMDHSMLTAMAAVDNIINSNNSKDNLWAVNAEDEYHEE